MSNKYILAEINRRAPRSETTASIGLTDTARIRITDAFRDTRHEPASKEAPGADNLERPMWCQRQAE
jgi:hypothetical protein